MGKDRISRISVQMLNGENYGVPIIDGDAIELIIMSMSVASTVAINNPDKRWAFRKLFRRLNRKTYPDWFQRFINDLPWGIFGAVVLFGAVYGLSYICHWVGIV